MIEGRLKVESKKSRMFSNRQERSHKQQLAETPCTEQYARCFGKCSTMKERTEKE